MQTGVRSRLPSAATSVSHVHVQISSFDQLPVGGGGSWAEYDGYPRRGYAVLLLVTRIEIRGKLYPASFVCSNPTTFRPSLGAALYSRLPLFSHATTLAYICWCRSFALSPRLSCPARSFFVVFFGPSTAFLVTWACLSFLLRSARCCLPSVMPCGDVPCLVLSDQIDNLRERENVLVLTTSNVSEAIDLAFVDRADIKQ